MKKLIGAATLLCAAMLSAGSAQAFPKFLLYQGQYLNNGTPSEGNVSMEFRVTKNGASVPCGASSNANLYWTSGSTAVATSNGLFSYKLGLMTDGVTQDPDFAAINAGAPGVTFYIDVCVLGAQLTPKEPIGATMFSMYSTTAAFAAVAGSVSSPPAGYCGLLCDGACVNEQVDPNHCGDCDTRCSQGQACADGACATVTCFGGTSLCSGSCQNLQTSDNNCGACGNACGTNSNCVSGSCVVGDCDNGDTRSCYGLAGTPGVGACSNGTQTCSGGAWGSCSGEVGPASESCDGVDNDCDGVVDEDFNLQTDIYNCGRCNTAQDVAALTQVNQTNPLVCNSGVCNGQCGGAGGSNVNCLTGNSCVDGLCQGPFIGAGGCKY